MKEITVPASIESIPKVTEWIDEALETLQCSMKAQMQLDVAIDEILGNIARYAYPEGRGDATVRYDFDCESGLFSVVFSDRGTPFDPLKKGDPDVTLGPEEREIGGLGIFLVKKTMDDVTYQYRNGENVLTLKKRIK